MKDLHVRITDEQHEAIRIDAFNQKKSIAKLIREYLDIAFTNKLIKQTRKDQTDYKSGAFYYDYKK